MSCKVVSHPKFAHLTSTLQRRRSRKNLVRPASAGSINVTPEISQRSLRSSQRASVQKPPVSSPSLTQTRQPTHPLRFHPLSAHRHPVAEFNTPRTHPIVMQTTSVHVCTRITTRREGGPQSIRLRSIPSRLRRGRILPLNPSLGRASEQAIEYRHTRVYGRLVTSAPVGQCSRSSTSPRGNSQTHAERD